MENLSSPDIDSSTRDLLLGPLVDDLAQVLSELLRDMRMSPHAYHIRRSTYISRP